MTPNVLLIVLDSVRAANVGHHGHEHDTTPFLDSFAARATTFTQARAPGTWSLPSHTSIFTGLHVAEHGLTRARHRLQPGNTVFETLASEHAHATGLFTENTWLAEMNVGLKDAFETVVGPQSDPYPRALNPRNFLMSSDDDGLQRYLDFVRACRANDHPLQSLANGAHFKLASDFPRVLRGDTSTTPASVYADRFLAWERDQDGPWAACVNLMDAHHPYEPDAQHDHWGGPDLRRLQDDMTDADWEFSGGARPWWQKRALEGLYDGAIRQLDHELERIITALDERDALDETLVVVTSDHGEGFGEPSHLRPDTRISAHAAGLHEVLLHVPLVVRTPGQDEGAVVDEAASLTQFPAVVRAALDDEADAARRFVPDGPVLASFHGLEEPMEKRARRYVDDLWRFNGDSYAVITNEGRGTRTYSTWRDENAVAVQIPDAKARYVHGTDDFDRVRDAFDPLADAGVVADAESSDVSEGTQRRLEHLGYR